VIWLDVLQTTKSLIVASALILVGSIANLIVDLAQRARVRIDWRIHAREGVPVSLLTLLMLWLWGNYT
jgi:hypothetical protein